MRNLTYSVLRGLVSASAILTVDSCTSQKTNRGSPQVIYGDHGVVLLLFCIFPGQGIYLSGSFCLELQGFEISQHETVLCMSAPTGRAWLALGDICQVEPSGI